MSDERHHDIVELERLWHLDYKELAMAPGKPMSPGEPKASLTMARFVLQGRVALETKSLIKSTFWLAVATAVMAIATIALAVITVVAHPT
jgi:hypothetical protein